MKFCFNIYIFYSSHICSHFVSAKTDNHIEVMFQSITDEVLGIKIPGKGTEKSCVDFERDCTVVEGNTVRNTVENTYDQRKADKVMEDQRMAVKAMEDQSKTNTVSVDHKKVHKVTEDEKKTDKVTEYQKMPTKVTDNQGKAQRKKGNKKTKTSVCVLQ